MKKEPRYYYIEKKKYRVNGSKFLICVMFLLMIILAGGSLYELNAVANDYPISYATILAAFLFSIFGALLVAADAIEIEKKRIYVKKEVLRP